MTKPRQAGERDQLLQRALEHLVQHGLADLSLRSLADQIGTSHRMLIYHFGSASQFWQAVFGRLRREQMQAFTDEALRQPRPGLMDIWAELSAPRNQSLFRLMFTIYGTALSKPAEHPEFLQEIVDLWIDRIAESLMTERQLTPTQARTGARLHLAVIRGLMLDLLTTGDLEGTTEAMALFTRSTASPSLA